MSDTQLRTLFEQHEPDEPPVPEGFAASVLDAGRGRVRRHRARRAALTGGVAAVAAVALLGGAMLTGGTQAGRHGRTGASGSAGAAGPTFPAGRPVDAADLLNRASVAAEYTALTVQPGQYIYTAGLARSPESEQGSAGAQEPENVTPPFAVDKNGKKDTAPATEMPTSTCGAPAAGQSAEQYRSWVSADGSKQGKDISPGHGGTVCVNTLPTNADPSFAAPTYEYLTTLPTDPDALLTMFRKAAQARADQKPGQQDLIDSYMFEDMSQLLYTGVLPGKLAAAIYTDLGRLKGVSLVRNATDASGRHGMGVAMADPLPGGFRTTLIFDLTSYEYLGERVDDPATGTYWNWTSIVTRGVVDRVGQTPK